MKYVEVAVDAPAGQERTFSYSVPSHLELFPGQLVIVPFGSRTLQGIVFSTGQAPQVSETKDVINLVHSEPLLTHTNLELARWISRYYMAPLFESAALMLPPWFKNRLKDYVSVSPKGRDESIHSDSEPEELKLLDYLREFGTVEKKRLLRHFGLKSERILRGLIRRELVSLNTGWDSPKARPKYVAYMRLSNAVSADLQVVLERLSQRESKKALLVRYLASKNSLVAVSDLNKLFGNVAVRSLAKENITVEESVRLERDPLIGRSFQKEPVPILTPHQEQAVSEISSALDGRSSKGKVFLMCGVTGSGKTEVYLRAIEKCLQMGKRAILLVPEISLTPQTVERCASRFPGQVALVHSRLSPGQQFDQWWHIREGKYGLVVGPRSAVFAPQPDLGLVVIDEEHEWTYKQEEQIPYYHARSVALKLAELTGATLVLGSATPDVSSYYHANRGGLRLLELPYRLASNWNGSAEHGTVVRNGALAEATVVDMRRELKEGNSGIFSRALFAEMQFAMSKGEQIILFLNRRGTGAYVQCAGCGSTLKCRRCDVVLTYHGKGDGLLCHYCNDKKRMPDKCPGCQSRRLRTYGIGTQTVVDEIATRFPGANVLRWDRDATKNPKAHEEILDRFRKGEAQILVGTQMIAKGLHIPSVTLVGVVLADTGLNVPDFRSGERTFQVLCQIAGRAGRGTAPGKVIIQTFQPEHYAIEAAAKQEYKAFHRTEIEFRRQYGNPPFNRLIRMLYHHINNGICQRQAEEMARVLVNEKEASGVSDVEIIGPAPAFPSRVRGRYRWHLILRGRKPSALLEKVTVPNGWTIDVDPVTTR